LGLANVDGVGEIIANERKSMARVLMTGIALAGACLSLALPGAAARAGSYKVVANFDKDSGSGPEYRLTELGGLFFGVTGGGTQFPNGTVFSFGPHHKLALVAAFSGNGAPSDPSSPLLNVNGTFYGVSFYGGECCGTIYSVTPSGTVTVLHVFGEPSGSYDGYYPIGGLINVNGTLYGVTNYGGINNVGAMFSVTPDGTYTVLHSFDAKKDHVAYPNGGLVFLNGRFYGLAANTGHMASVYSVDAKLKVRSIYTFDDGQNGQPSISALVAYRNVLYGTTPRGGSANHGTVFAVTKDGAYSVVYNFHGKSDGEAPDGLTESGGVLYGTTGAGGGTGCDGGCGTAYSLTTAGVETILHSFAGGTEDGQNPSSTLLRIGGNLYGVTSGGGRNGEGTAFRVPK
jgi:uncharacterized repeat protein (TIGR03803 family)